jgi:hypothetical protein
MDVVAQQNALLQWLHRKGNNFYLSGIHALVQRWRKIFVKYEEYVEI